MPHVRVAISSARVAAGLGGILLFILALQLVKAGARGIVPLLDGLDIAGPANSVGFGWLMFESSAKPSLVVAMVGTSA